MSRVPEVIKEFTGIVVDCCIPGEHLPVSCAAEIEIKERANSKGYFLLQTDEGILEVHYSMNGHTLPLLFHSIKGKRVSLTAQQGSMRKINDLDGKEKDEHTDRNKLYSSEPIRIIPD
jgi:hypothetical protein